MPLAPIKSVAYFLGHPIYMILTEVRYNNLNQSWREKTQGHLVPTMNGSYNEF